MFSKEEVKEFIVKYGKKWFFPNFTNKVTWYVATLGAGIIITPAPLKVAFYNWLIDTFNLNLGKHFTLSEVSSNTADYWLGFALIITSLLHNIGVQYLQSKNNQPKQTTEKELSFSEQSWKYIHELFYIIRQLPDLYYIKEVVKKDERICEDLCKLYKEFSDYFIQNKPFQDKLLTNKIVSLDAIIEYEVLTFVGLMERRRAKNFKNYVAREARSETKDNVGAILRKIHEIETILNDDAVKNV